MTIESMFDHKAARSSPTARHPRLVDNSPNHQRSGANGPETAFGEIGRADDALPRHFFQPALGLAMSQASATVDAAMLSR
jgi:hypothetical protein